MARDNEFDDDAPRPRGMGTREPHRLSGDRPYDETPSRNIADRAGAPGRRADPYGHGYAGTSDSSFRERGDRADVRWPRFARRDRAEGFDDYGDARPGEDRPGPRGGRLDDGLGPYEEEGSRLYGGYGGAGRSFRGKGPKNYRRSDARIEEDVHERLTDDHVLDASDIAVTVKDAEVTLDGTVPSRRCKRRAEDIVDAVSGVRHTQNNLRIAESGA